MRIIAYLAFVVLLTLTLLRLWVLRPLWVGLRHLLVFLQRFFLRLLLGLTLFFAVLGCFWQFWMLPRLEYYRPMIAAQLSEATGLPFEIGKIKGGWDNLQPYVSFGQVRIKDARQVTALQFSELEGTLAWWSLPLGQLRFSHIALHDPELHMLRDRSGHWVLAGQQLQGGGNKGGDDRLGNWLLAQGGLSLSNGHVLLTDALQQQATTEIRQLQFSSSNLFGYRRVNFSFLPPEAMAGRVSGSGWLWGSDISQSADWLGKLDLSLPRVDLSRLYPWIQPHLPQGMLAVGIRQGNGRLALNLAFGQGRVDHVEADLGLAAVEIVHEQKTFALPLLDARLVWDDQLKQRSLKVEARKIVGSAGVLSERGQFVYTAQGRDYELDLQNINLAGFNGYQIWLPARWQPLLESGKVAGMVSHLNLGWQGDWQKAAGLHGTVTVKNVVVALPNSLKRLGPFNAEGQFDSAGGRATLNSNGLWVSYPGQLAEQLYFHELGLDTTWTRKGDEWTFDLPRIRVRNQEVSLNLRGQYQTRWQDPGRLQLKGKVEEVQADRIYAYLPTAAGPETVAWLKTGLRAGRAYDASVDLDGELKYFPFATLQQGRFVVQGKTQGVEVDPGNGWAPIRDIDADLSFVGRSMLVQARSAKIQGVIVQPTEAKVVDLLVDPVLEVKGKIGGASSEFVRFLRENHYLSPRVGMISTLQAQGQTLLDLDLKVPFDNADNTTVKGIVNITQNKLDFGGSVPPLDQATGQVVFTEAGVNIPAFAATGLGGQVRLSGVTAANGRLTLNIKGNALAAEVAKRYGPQLAGSVSGNLAYQGQLAFGRDDYDLNLQSDLASARLDLPAPLNKPLGRVLPLRLHVGGVKDTNQIDLGLNGLLQVALQQKGKQPMTGTLSLGPAIVPIANSAGLVVTGSWPELDANAWVDFSNRLPVGNGGDSLGGLTRVDLKVGKLYGWGSQINDLTLQAQPYAGNRWNIRFGSKEAAGQLAWAGGSGAKLQARLERLTVPLPEAPKTTLAGSGNRSMGATASAGSSRNWPDIDLRVEDFRVHNYELGQLVVQAMQQGGAWRIDRAMIKNPDGQLNFTGQWQNQDRNDRTSGTLTASTESLGKLLTRLGYPETMQRGATKLTGEASWQGSPFAPDLASLNGRLRLDVQAGQFIKINQPGAARFMSILSLQALTRRVRLDFRDVFSDGLEFDSIEGDAIITRGVAHTQNLLVSSSAAKILFTGDINIPAGTQRLKVRIVPMVSETVAIVTGVVNPFAGLAALLLQKVFKDPLGQLIAYEYEITGSMQDPQIRKVE